MRISARFGLMVAVIAALSLIAGYAIAAGTPRAFAPDGNSRYASVTSVDVTIPGGKEAEVFVTFSGVVNTCSAMYVRALLGGNIAAPNSAQFMWNLAGGAESHAFTFVGRLDAGIHTIKIQWRGLTNCAQQFVGARSMVVVANIHV
jgi:hypothetical protein